MAHRHCGLKNLVQIAVVFSCALLIGSCQASQDRFATETAQARTTAVETATHTPSGDLLRIDGDPVLRVFIAALDGPARYAVTAQRLYRNEGGDWIATEAAADVRTILVDPSLPERLFRGNHPPCSDQIDEEPITFSKSTDGGNTWRAIPAGDNIQPLAIDPALGNVIYGSDCGLAISSDAGETWRDYYRSRGHTVVDAVVVGERLLVLETSVSGRGRVRSINVTVPEDPELVDVLIETGVVFDLDARPERFVIGGIEGVAVSVDSGETWTTSRNGLEDVTVESAASLPPLEEGDIAPAAGVLTVRLDPSRSQRIFAGTVRGLYISQDAGLTWDVYSQVAFDARIVDIQFASGGNDIYVTTPEGVLVVPNP